MKAIIAAMDKNNGIGANNDMPWGRSLPADLAHFKMITMGGSLIMGRKTFESIGRRPLPKRENIVVSRTSTDVAGVLSANSLAEAYTIANHPIFVIGGGSIYEQAINDMDTLYITEITTMFPDASIFFPVIDLKIWQEVEREHHEVDSDNRYPFDWVVYKKR